MQHQRVFKMPLTKFEVLTILKVEFENLEEIYRVSVCFSALSSISPTIYEQLLRQNPFAKKLQTLIVST
jgi:hypothetical protein